MTAAEAVVPPVALPGGSCAGPPTIGRVWVRGPEEELEGAEAGGVEERLGFPDAGSAGEGGEVAPRRALGPAASALLDQGVDPEAAQRVGLAGSPRRRRELVEGHLAGDVLPAGVVEGVAAGAVATVGADPRPPGAAGEVVGGRAVVHDQHPVGATAGLGQPRPGGVDEGHAGPGGAGPAGSRASSDDRSLLLAPRRRPAPPASRAVVIRARHEPERQVVEQLVRHDHVAAPRQRLDAADRGGVERAGWGGRSTAT